MKRRDRQWIPPVVAATGVVMLLVAAVFLVNRESAASVATNAETSIVADNALSAVAAVRTGTLYAYNLVSLAPGTGEAENALDALQFASDDSEKRLGRTVSKMTATEKSELLEASGEFMATTDRAVAAMRERDLEDAAIEIDAQGEAFASLNESLVAVRDARTQEVLVAGEGVGRVAESVRFLILFFIPLAVMFTFWRVMRGRAERRRFAEELERHRQIAQSKDDFVADVSHELRTPLTGIYGFAFALEESGESLSDYDRELVGLIVNESAELARMVDDLVAIGRIDAGAVSYSYEPVVVAEEIEEVMKPFRRRGISIEYESVDIAVVADRSRLRQILRNLMSNAVKYGGEAVAVGVWRGENSTVIEVIDDGPGVPHEVEERLFERYVHTEGSALIEGSVGLGLAIARSFAEGMGGGLSYSRVDGLTVFRVTLPSHPTVSPADSELAVVQG